MKCIGFGLNPCRTEIKHGIRCESCGNKKREHEQSIIADGIEEGCHEHTDEITCPYCGYVESDSQEAPDEDDEYTCGGCLKVYQMVRNEEITYSTYKI